MFMSWRNLTAIQMSLTISAASEESSLIKYKRQSWFLTTSLVKRSPLLYPVEEFPSLHAEIIRELSPAVKRDERSDLSSRHSPFHHNQETLLPIVGVLIYVLDVDNVATSARPPVKLYLSPRILRKRFLFELEINSSDLLFGLSFNTFKAHFSPL